MRFASAIPALLLAGLGLAVPLAAQVPRPVQFGIGVGLTVLAGEDRDFFKDGLNVTGNLTLNIPAARIGLRGEVMYHTIGGKKGASGGSDTLVFDSFKVLAGIASVTYQLSPPLSPAQPYVLLGGGIFNSDADVVYYGTPASASSTDFGIAAGAGVRARLGGVRLFVEGRVQNIFGEGESARFYPFTAGIVF